uniref:Papain-like cis-acting proteinase n=1 Tax=Cryphonectria hypovirus 3 TaxID=106962 RepID=Q9IF58_9VIRU|nr:papain-like cis-acting proteinase [Cryphonectria hypovirus 3]
MREKHQNNQPGSGSSRSGRDTSVNKVAPTRSGSVPDDTRVIAQSRPSTSSGDKKKSVGDDGFIPTLLDCTSYGGARVGGEPPLAKFTENPCYPVPLGEQLKLSPDFTVCRCQVHIRPASYCLTDLKGCALKQVGNHPVIQAAAKKQNTFCHVSEDVRRLDRNFVELVCNSFPNQPAFSVFEGNPLANRLASSHSADVKDFGMGYCALSVLRPTLRWRSARVLGPDCLLGDFDKVFNWAGLKQFKAMTFVEVYRGFYHLVTVPGAKGVDLEAGENLKNEISKILEKNPDARVGTGSDVDDGTYLPPGYFEEVSPEDGYFEERDFPLDLCMEVLFSPSYLERAREWVDARPKFGQDVHQAARDFNAGYIWPTPGTGEREEQGTSTGWTGIDHADSVCSVQEALLEEKTPMVTGVPGAGKSTDFIISLKRKYRTVIVACPRQILVKNNPVAETKLYAGCEDNLTTGCINFGTASYLRRMLADLPEGTVLCLDDFHEMDEDSLWLLDRYRGQCVVITATPDFCGSQRFSEVRLSKGRNSAWTIQDDFRDTPGKLEDGWNCLMESAKTNDRVRMIVPRIQDVETCKRHAAQLVTNKRVCGLYRGQNTVTKADWYFATSIVDAGLTIPGLTKIIVLGWSLGYKHDKFIIRPSSRNIFAQRRGRTGRTCAGQYIRLVKGYDDSNWDFSTPFQCNSWSTAQKWDPNFRRGKCRTPGMIEALPGGYESVFGESDWSMVLYAVFMYDARLDANRARASYQAMRKFPERKEFSHLTGRIENFHFDDLFMVEDKLKRFQLPGQNGDFWSWDLHSCVQVDFEQNAHLIY